MEENRIEGAIVRSRIQWQREGEKCNKYFFNLESKKGNDKQIVRLKDANDRIYQCCRSNRCVTKVGNYQK